jgi:uncharacterized protein
MRSADDSWNVPGLLAIVGLLLTLPAGAQPDNNTEFRQFPKIGAYQSAGRIIYVGIEGEPPDHPVAEYYDPGTRRVGRLDPVANQEYRDHGYSATFTLNSPKVGVVEKRFLVGQGSEKLGASLWFTSGARRLPTIILFHGNESETRQMGFLIPYFVAHGLTVVTYDQRGTGESAGDWLSASPDAEADDALALIKAVESDPAVDSARIGLWGFSHGGWVAPIVATRFPVAFMILKSAASQTIVENVLYEVEQDLREGNHFTPDQVSDAVALVRMMLSAVQTNSNWEQARQGLERAKSQPWFSHIRIPQGMTFPPAPPMLAALRASLIYDPTPILQQVHTPTLALFGTLDRSNDSAGSAEGFRKDFKKSGITDFTVLMFPGAGHILLCSKTGYSADRLLPERTVKGYPEAIITWLHARGIGHH